MSFVSLEQHKYENRKTYRLKTALLVASVSLSALSLTPAPIYAQATSSHSIPAGPLDSALTRFGAASGVQLLYSSSLTQGLRTSGASGNLTPEDTLGQLLRGTGLSYRFTGPKSATIGRSTASTDMDADGSTMLDPIILSGAGPFGATKGYVAESSRTATKTGAALIETPQSISVVTRKQLDDQNVQTVSQALRYTAGVTSEARAGRYDYPNIRGFGAPGGADANFVGLLDGMRLPRGVYYIAPSIDPYMLERVELLRGPSSVLYGAINPGGVVNLLSKRPTAETLREVELQYGSFNRRQIGFDFSGSVNDDSSLLYRLTGVARLADTQVNFTKDERYSVAPALTWRPDDDTRLTVLGHFQNDPSAGAFTYLPYAGTVAPTPGGFRFSRDFFEGDPSFDRSHRKQGAIGYEFEHRFSDTWTVRQNLRYMRLDYDYRSVFETGWKPGYTELHRGTVASVESADTFTVDTQAQAEFDTGAIRHTALLGVDYRHNKGKSLLGMGTAPDLNVADPSYGGSITALNLGDRTDQTLDQLGFYAQDQMKWGNWTWLLGARADNVGTTTTSGGTIDQSQRAFTWRTGLVYEFDGGIAPYLNYATSFDPVTGTDFFNRPFKPTEGEQFEIGVKYQPAGWSGFLQASVFDLTQTNVKTADPDPSHPYSSVQTGEVRSRGIELEAQANVTDDLSLIAAYSHIDIENTKDTSYQGKRPFGVPNHLASLWVNYAVPSGALAGLSIGGGVRYVGSSAGNATNTIQVPSVTLFGAALRYDFGAFDPKYEGTALSVNASNLFDKKYVASCWNEMSCFYGAGRTITANLKVRW